MKHRHIHGAIALVISLTGFAYAGDGEPAPPAKPSNAEPRRAALKEAREERRELADEKRGAKKGEKEDEKEREAKPEGDKTTPDEIAAGTAKVVDDAVIAAKAALKDAKGDLKVARGVALDAYKKAQKAIAEAKSEAEKTEQSALLALDARKHTADERKAIIDAARAKVKAAREALKQQLIAARATLGEATPEPLTEEEREKIRKKFNEGADKRREARKGHVKTEREELDKRFGKKLEEPEVRDFVREHSWRIARLTALSEMADAKGNTALKARAEELIKKENERFEKASTRFAEKSAAKADVKAEAKGATK